jgi:hypothetical protein
MDKNQEKRSIGSVRHLPESDAATINRAVERAVEKPSLIDYTIGHLSDLKFPADRKDIVAYAKDMGAEEQVMQLLENLDGYIQYRDLYHVKNALEANLPQSKEKVQMTEETRTRPNFRVRETTTGESIKQREAVSEKEERKDYPEVTPTAAKEFICSRCGKDFPSPDDLLKHEQFESGAAGAGGA